MMRSIWSLPFCFLVLMGCSRSEQKPPATRAIPAADATAKVGFSGMALLAPREFIVVHDVNSDKEGARFGSILVDEKGDAVYKPMPFHGSVTPNDLESICAIPGLDREFLALESGTKANSARVFHIVVEKVAEEWKATSKGVLRVPHLVVNVEGAVCIADKTGQLMLLLGERGGTKKNPGGRLHWGPIDLNHAKGERRLSWPASQHADLTLLPGFEKGWRGCTDLYLDPENVLWCSSGFDAGDKGPFRSKVSRVGVVQVDNPAKLFIPDKSPQAVVTLEGRKIEGIAAPLIKGKRFSVVTDDEDLGGMFLSVGEAS